MYQWSFKRNKRDDRNINLMIAKAEKIAAGAMPLRKARFLKVSGARKELDQTTIDRARQLAGIKGYVTNIPPDVMPGSTVISAYHDLWKVEQSFRMTRSDLKARSVFHHQRDAIEVHLTVVFAALAITRHLTSTTGVSVKKFVRTLQPLRSVCIAIGPRELTAEPQINADARATVATGRPVLSTSFTASSLYPGENCRRCLLTKDILSYKVSTTQGQGHQSPWGTRPVKLGRLGSEPYRITSSNRVHLTVWFCVSLQ